MMTVRVRCAFFTPGSRKAFTPLLTASTPVRAVQPLAKTFSKSHKVTASVMAGGGGSGATGTGCPPLRASRARRAAATSAGHRSEEHTSELQSHLNLVCRLLLEK